MSNRVATVALSLIAASSAISSAGPSLPEMRMTPAEISASAFDGGSAGSSRLSGVHSKVLFGDPTRAEAYAILLFVPPHTTIQAHSHRDHRMATVVSGTWHFGYGHRFDGKSLKALPAGSVYSEPGGVDHFAQTVDDPVVVQISGFGPTDTHYVDPADEPEKATGK
jgi:quercetin dioxygenase-like cupin family protein